MIEVLVAMLVLSIGFLAAGRMQMEALRDNQEAYHDSQAQLLLDDMIDRMRSNPAGVRAGAYDGRDTGSAVETDCAAAACDAAELARHHLFEWSKSLEPVLGGAVPRLPVSAEGESAVGSIGAPVDGVYTLALEWQVRIGDTEESRTADARFVP